MSITPSPAPSFKRNLYGGNDKREHGLLRVLRRCRNVKANDDNVRRRVSQTKTRTQRALGSGVFSSPFKEGVERSSSTTVRVLLRKSYSIHHIAKRAVWGHCTGCRRLAIRAHVRRDGNNSDTGCIFDFCSRASVILFYTTLLAFIPICLGSEAKDVEETQLVSARVFRLESDDDCGQSTNSQGLQNTL